MSQGSPRRTSSVAAAGPGAEPPALFDVVRVLRAVPEYGLAGGEEGTVVEILDDPNRAYLVDFSSGSADRSASELPVYPLSAELIMPVSKVRRAAVT